MSSHLSEDEIACLVIGERDAAAEQHLHSCAVCIAEVRRTERAFALFRDSGRRWSDHWSTTTPVRVGRLRGAVAIAGMLVLLTVSAVVLLWTPTPTAARENPFIGIPYVVLPAPYERTAVVRMDIPVAALTAAGFKVYVADVSGTVAADVLVGQDGRALAVRAVSKANSVSERR